MKNQFDPQMLEQAIDRELRQLPPETAPATLLPRVLAALRQSAGLPWWHRPWQTWPASLQVASAALVFAGLGLLFVYGPAAADAVRAGWLAQQFSGTMKFLSPYADSVGALGKPLLAAGRKASSLVLFGVFAVWALMYLSCVGLGTVFVRMAILKR